MSRRCFVRSLAMVSCQDPLTEAWAEEPRSFDTGYVRAAEPDTRGLILPSEARRMSRILKRAVATSLTALNTSGIEHPDAIITGTGMGCIENSEKFLIDLSRFGESCLKPTLFMQSTHNTISSLIAIILKCHGYNNTYSHKGISFESALLDAWIQIRGGMLRNALVGSHDEVTPFLALVMDRTHPDYSMISETSVSSMLTCSESADNRCEITDVRILNRPDIGEVAALLSKDEDELLILGTNGNRLNDALYDELLDKLDFSPRTMGYKHLFGENFSSPAAAFVMGATMLGKGEAARVTIINHSDSSAWSVVRLKAVTPCGS